MPQIPFVQEILLVFVDRANKLKIKPQIGIKVPHRKTVPDAPLSY